MSTVQGAAFVSEETLLDPYGFYESLRAQPVVETPVGYLVTRYADVVAVAQNTTVFSSNLRGDRGTQWGDEPTPEMKEELAKGYPEANTMVTSDPPAHGRFKALVQRGFRPARVAEMEPTLSDVVDELIERFADAGTVEFVSQFAVPYPLTMIAEFLGCDRDMLPQFKRWSDDALAPLSGLLDDAGRLRCVKSRVESQHFMIGRIRARAAEPGNDLLSDLVHAEVDGDRLSELEVLSMALGILVAGNESSRNSLSNGMAYLSRRPELADLLRSDPGTISQFVEELLRWEAPVQTLFRVATEDTEVGGTAIPKGARVAISWASANRDPEKWERPDEFDLERQRMSQTLAFGYGEHKCIGAALARAELRVGFTRLLERMGDIRPAPGDDIRTRSVTMRGFQQLPLAFTPR